MKKLFLFAALFFFAQLSAQWTNMNLSTSHNLVACSFPSDNTGYIVGDKLYKTTNSGYSFDSIVIPGLNLLQDVYFCTDSIGIVSGHFGSGVKLFRTIDGGASWSEIPTTPDYSYMGHLYMTDSTHIAYESVNTYYGTFDGGLNWHTYLTYPNFRITSMNFVSAAQGYITGGDLTSYYGRIYETLDSGQTWVLKHDFINSYTALRQIQFINPDTGYVSQLITSNSMLRTVDGGTTWTSFSVPNGDALQFLFTDSRHGFISNANSSAIVSTSTGNAPWINDWSTTKGVSEFARTNYYIYAVGTEGLAIVRNLPAGIQNEGIKTKVKIYPNPGSDQVIVQLPEEMQIVSVIATDALGRNYSNLDFTNKNAGEIMLNTKPLACGNYILEIYTGEEVLKVKFEKI